MTEDKKTDDYMVEMNKLDQGSKNFEPAAIPPPRPRSSASNAALNNNPILPVLSYCGSSILMTVMNKYVLSGLDFNLNFFLLCVQVRCLPYFMVSGDRSVLTESPEQHSPSFASLQFRPARRLVS
jgi:hypothetical protein